MASLLPPTNKIHVVFKTHLDVGFTDFSQTVVQNYFDHYIPSAIGLAKRLRLADSRDRFIWTTGSWLIYEFLEQAAPDQRKLMEEAILAGDIAWHGLPFTTHSELMDASLFRFGLSLSQELDRRFGKHTVAAKMSDVPGHTRGIVPLLVEAGVKFLHIGVNAASTPPAVPPLFVWQDPSGAEVNVMYHKGSYGDLMLVPGLTEGIAFAHTGDNLGPQTEEQLHAAYHALRQQFPGVQVSASTLDAFAQQVESIKASLPVIRAEIGDTWIHGGGTDPYKISRFRQLLRWRETVERTNPTAAGEDGFKRFSRRLLQVPEHTWGLDIKTHLGDFTAYQVQDFQPARSRAGFRKVEASWAEQRDYITQAVDAVPTGALKEAALTQLKMVEPTPPDLTGFEPASISGQVFQVGGLKARFSEETGALIYLYSEINQKQWASPANPLGLLCYELFSQGDYEHFYRNYVKNKRETSSWSIPDFTKPGLGDASGPHRIWLPRLVQAWKKEDARRLEVLMQLTLAAECWQNFGGPRRIFIRYSFHKAEPAVTITVNWFDKPACRLPEAMWFSFIPRVAHPAAWRMDKLDQLISPLEVIKDGNRHLHAVGKGIYYQDSRCKLEIASLDAPLVAPGEPSLLNFNNRQPVLSRGMHFNLYNNIWGTNFPMWYEDPAIFRFELRF